MPMCQEFHFRPPTPPVRALINVPQRGQHHQNLSVSETVKSPPPMSSLSLSPLSDASSPSSAPLASPSSAHRAFSLSEASLSDSAFMYAAAFAPAASVACRLAAAAATLAAAAEPPRTLAYAMRLACSSSSSLEVCRRAGGECGLCRRVAGLALFPPGLALFLGVDLGLPLLADPSSRLPSSSPSSSSSSTISHSVPHK